MDELELMYETKEEIPSGYEKLYSEKDGKWSLTGVRGLSGLTSGKANLQKALDKEREQHKETKTKLKEAEDGKAEIESERDQFKLKAESNGNVDTTKIDEIVETRVKAKLTPLERKLQEAQSQAAEWESKYTTVSTEQKQSQIRSAIQDAAAKEGVDPKMLNHFVRLVGTDMDFSDDGSLIVSENSKSFTPGLDLSSVISDLKKDAPGFWPVSKGAGARGGGDTTNEGGPNPFSYQHWNVTKQMSLPEGEAKKLAERAGVDFGNPKRPPAPKE